ncbi:hypothetical protein C0J52_00815 [Blattella germanica]|nr:hypothetical protein C0J52_00815 [Blattella germanica]
MAAFTGAERAYCVFLFQETQSATIVQHRFCTQLLCLMDYLNKSAMNACLALSFFTVTNSLDEIFSGTTSSALQERNRNLLRTSSQPSCSSKNISNLSSILTSPENRKSFPSVPFVKHLQARSNSASSRNVGLLTDEIELLSPEKQMRKMLENVNLIHTSKDVDSESRSDTTSAIECNRGSRAFSEPPPSPVRNVDHETSIKPSPQSSEAIDKITGSDSSPDGKVKSPRRSRSLTRSPPPHFWLRTRNSGRSNKSKDIVKKSSSKKVNGSQPSILDTEIRTRSKMSTASVSQNSEDLTPSSKSSASGTTGKLSGVTNDGSLSPSSGSAVSKNKHIKKSLLEIFAKGFSPSISEIVKQRRRIIPLNESTTGGGQGPILGTIVEGEENSTEKMKKNVDSSYALIDKVSDDDIIASLSEADTVSIASEGSKYGNESENVEDSTKALLRILESDNESYDDQENGYSSDFYQSDIQNDDSNICTSPSGSQNPKSAYVRVEKLSPEIDSKSSVQRIKDYETLTPKRRPRKDKGQSNQYRLVKIVKDETGKERFKCLKCGSLLSHRTYIKEHMKIHTGDKSFICIICNKAFRNNYLLKSHMGVHTKERNFKCDICGHTFVQRDRLRSHLRIHKLEPCKCKICGRVLTQKQSLLRHMRLHTGERPFKCDYCENTFADRTTWINHTRTHTGERPFK